MFYRERTNEKLASNNGKSRERTAHEQSQQQEEGEDDGEEAAAAERQARFLLAIMGMGQGHGGNEEL